LIYSYRPDAPQRAGKLVRARVDFNTHVTANHSSFHRVFAFQRFLRVLGMNIGADCISQRRDAPQRVRKLVRVRVARKHLGGGYHQRAPIDDAILQPRTLRAAQTAGGVQVRNKLRWVRERSGRDERSNSEGEMI
jgi:hypothetical protein